jgi:hypothetical protein
MDARKAGIILFAAAAATALLATFTGFPPDWKPAGVEKPAPVPSLRPKSLLSGTFEEAFERYFARRFGLRGYGIRLAHQLEWSMFGTLPRIAGTAVDEGADHWLYEHEYVKHHVHRYEMRRREALEFAARMATLRNHLAQRGIPLVVCVSPSKAAVYPEYLPVGAAPSAEEKRNTPARDQLVMRLRHAGVAVVDARSLFRAWKRKGPPLFARSGTHWNAYGAQRVFDAVVAAARAQNPSLPPVPTVAGHVEDTPLMTDHDLSALYNMVRYPFPEKTVPYPVFSGPPEPTGRRLRILGVGDSFSFQLADAMGRCGAVESYRLLYYNKADYRFKWAPGERPRENKSESFRQPSFDCAAFDIDEATRDVDLVLVELNDIFARNRAWGFGSELRSEPDGR